MSLSGYVRLARPTIAELIRTRRPRTRIAVLKTVWGHHARRSGYQPVGDGLGVSILARGRLLPAHPSRWIARRWGGDDLDHALQIALSMWLCRRDTLLMVDGDFGFELALDVKRASRARVFAVFHQIVPFLEERFAGAPPGSLDGVICVARCQLDHVRHLAPPGNAWFVPHGVDTQYFSPGGARSARPTVLCVGVHCRDFTTLGDAARRIRREIPDATVRLVAPREHIPSDADLSGVDVESGLSDEALRQAYREAWVALLPLTDSTANNALLEAMASGLPAVVTDTGGVPDYADPTCAVISPKGDAAAHARSVVGILADPARREAMGDAARRRAAAFEWTTVREQIRGILESGRR